MPKSRTDNLPSLLDGITPAARVKSIAATFPVAHPLAPDCLWRTLHTASLHTLHTMNLAHCAMHTLHSG